MGIVALDWFSYPYILTTKRIGNDSLDLVVVVVVVVFAHHPVAWGEANFLCISNR